MMHKLVFLSALLLAACQQSVPNSAAQGVGFGDYSDYEAQRARREADLTGSPLPPGMPISEESAGPGTAVASAGASGGTAARPDFNNPGISDEQSFEAVSNRETIESDAERLERQRAARVEVDVEALPRRPGRAGPSIVEFALATNNRVGQPVYKRGATSKSRHDRACARYRSPDLAQEAFLDAGGPQKDPQGLDPDGDGFACAWDPTPFRAARRG